MGKFQQCCFYTAHQVPTMYKKSNKLHSILIRSAFALLQVAKNKMFKQQSYVANNALTT
jgi:hypothetical protein